MRPKILYNFFMNLKIKYKLLVGMFIIVVFACGLMSTSCYIYFSAITEKTTNLQTQESLNTISTTLTIDINKLYKDISYFVCSKDFINLAKDIEDNNQDNFTAHYLDIQASLNNTITGNSLIDNIILIGKNNELYGPIDLGIKPLSTIASEFADLESTTGISWFTPYSSSAAYLNSEYIPVIFPISLYSSNHFPLIVSNNGESTLKLLIFINTSSLNEQLERLNRTPFATVYLANEKGEALSLPTSSQEYDLLHSPIIQEKISQVTEFSTFEVLFKEETYIISCTPLEMSHLKAVSAISKRVLLEGLSDIRIFTLFTLFISLSLSFIICLFLSRTLTAPLKKLAELVVTIDPSKDTPYFNPLYKDEIGVLASAFDHMCEVIKSQVACIKSDEKARHKAEINMLTHQINPHFLYNTLECIHWEILGENNANASLMVESLGDFLRLSLASKDNIISIRDEIKHTEKYITIINHRTNIHIEFMTLVEPHLLEHEIVRLILQPCIENCIKHGFNSESGEILIPNPLICVSISLYDNHLHLIIEDNGKGINTNKAEEALFGTSSTSKVGLKNIYQRLRVHYGEGVKVEFTSIPFYKNTVSFILPLKE